jgi:ribose transport system ATP-binding protein
MTTVPRLQLRGIQKRFPGVHALKGVSLDVHGGEVVALLGENGAGKSTLMKIVGGVEQPDAGEVLVDGSRVLVPDVQAAAALGIAFIHQELNVVDNLDVAGNILLGREPTRWGPLRLMDRAKMRAAVRPYLEQLGLDVSPDTPLTALSIAQQQLVEIAKALSLDARVLIMDEPTSSLTMTETARLHDVVSGLRARGVSIIYISHRLGEVQEIADRAVVLRDGANAGELSRGELTHDSMVRLMVGRDLAVRKPSDRQGVPTQDFFRVDRMRTRRYPRHEVTFAVRKGEVLGVAGLVGAGRSELARAIFGVEPPVSGVISIDGTTQRIEDAADAIGLGVFLVPEDRRAAGLVVDFSIRENVTLPALDRYVVHGLISAAQEGAAADRICRALNVKAPSIETKTANLSGGNQQKVVLAKWLALDPKVLIVDEPTRGIDVGAKSEIYALLRGLADAGVAILMISSDMEEVLNQSDRIVVMHEGRITGIIDRASATEERVLRLAVGRTDPDADGDSSNGEATQ